MTSESEHYTNFFRDNESRYARLVEEVQFILHEVIKRADVKIHSISGRVKTLESFLEKIDRKGYINPEEEIEDVVGCRVVCLFVSDLAALEAAIKEEFKVWKSENKVEGEGDEATFGYMSRHYIAELGNKHSGARYDSLKGVKFEIQVRTILMDAWANVSHYLAYKGKYSIPEDLRRDFYALSGLFYLADKHFELFFQEAIESTKRALTKAASGRLAADEPLNLETMEALLRELYPDRVRVERGVLSEFVEEIAEFGYTHVGELRSALIKANEAMLQMEKDYPPGFRRRKGERFADVGMARQTLGLADENYGKELFKKSSKPIGEYRALIQ